jgi:hypothetical protein
MNDQESTSALLSASGAGRSSYVRVCLTWLVTRVIALASIALTPRLLDDVDIYRGWLPYLRWMQFPFADEKWQYPPGAGPVLLAPSWLHINYSVAFAIACLLTDAAIMGLLIAAHARHRATPWAGLWLWAVAALVVGPILYTRFDLVPALFAVAFVILAARPTLAGASAALGFAVKVWPAVLLIALPRTHWRRGIASFAVTAAVILLAITARFDGAWNFLGNQRARGLQVEATGALPYELFALVRGPMRSGLEYGSYQVLMPGAELVGTIVFAAGIVLTALIAWWRLSGRLDAAPVGDVALTLILVSVATSRVYSPQYNAWTIAVAAAALMSPRTGMRKVAVILALGSVLTQVIYPWFPYDLMDGNLPVVLVQALRIGALVAATVLALRALLSSSSQDTGILDRVPEQSRPDSPEDAWTPFPASPSRSA